MKEKYSGLALLMALMLGLGGGLLGGRLLTLQGALVLRPGQDVVVSSGSPLSFAPYAAPPREEVAPLQIDINAAGEEELCKLPGIGPAKAGAIVEYRQQNGPFATTEELRAVRGIGDKTYWKIREHVTIGPIN